ncbi:hypothetical protein [Methylomicrobium lacus]|uniref:hypothetical protein n=1 Tax=Methylomicrobium lacus TaxID=136992 RepID=UPI00045EAF3B|nr:hypothetical protein [Methylomicrobium lacus]
MSIVKITVRWSLLLAGIALFIVYLNSAFYRAWLAGGPPTPNPEGWLFSAGNFLSWALAFLSAGVGVFLLIGSLPSLSRAAVVLLILASILGIIPSIREYLASDSCLDAGGKWSALELRCVHE